MTSFCEEDMDDIGAAGLLGEIENALGMGFGTLGIEWKFIRAFDLIDYVAACMYNN